MPFNIACYSLLTHMIAHVTGLKVGFVRSTHFCCHLTRRIVFRTVKFPGLEVSWSRYDLVLN